MALLSSVPWLICSGSAQSQEARVPEAEARAALRVDRLNAEGRVDRSRVRLQLAVEIEVTAEGVRALGATIVRAPDKSNSAQAGLRARATTGETVVADYVFPDPRLVEIEREGERTLQSATTIVFVPLSADLTELEILPVGGMETEVSRGGSIQLQGLVRRACVDRTRLDVCREVIRRPQPG